MKANRFILLIITAILVNPSADATSPTVRVACLGNSITYGAGVFRRELNCYPAQLQAMLGNGYEVRNFGVNGATVSQQGDIPYLGQAEYRQALAFSPDIVFIELGTNDSKPHNRATPEAFERDYMELISSFRELPSHPRIVLLLPPPVFLTDTTGITAAVIQEEILPAIRSVAYTSRCEVLNLYNYFLDSPGLFPDQIHPSSIGAGWIAARVYEHLQLTQDPNFDLLFDARIEGTRSNYHGFACTDFSFEGRSAKVVQPRIAAQGRPWLWRARFWGHFPQTEIALLERGFHLVYCDVAELFGNDESMAIWSRFYEMIVQAGLSRKAAFEGFSRGGIYIYRWAAFNPDRVACVYADAPVLDVKSWPGARGRSPGNPELWEKFKSDFGFRTDEEALAFQGNPLDLADRIARAGFPMLHVCGEKDETVPIGENTDIFERKVLAAGGRITVIRKPGMGHRPHGLPNPQPIVDFILRATGQKVNLARVPAPGNEYRESAGWKQGMDWHSLFDEMQRLSTNQKGVDIIFFGNSIVQGIGGKGRSITYAPGNSAFSSVFRGHRWLNFGLSGDRTQHLLWRILQGKWNSLKPRLIVLMIGVNNLPTDSGDEVAEGIKAILEAITGKADAARILLVGPLPAGEKNSPLRKGFETVHVALPRFGGGVRVSYTDLAFRMLKPDGSLNPTLFAPDGIHLAPGGYRMFAKLLADEISRLRLLK